MTDLSSLNYGHAGASTVATHHAPGCDDAVSADAPSMSVDAALPPLGDPAALLALFRDPADAGRRAAAWRATGYGREIRVRSAPPHAPEARATVLRAGLAVDPTAPHGPDVPVPPDLPGGPGPDRPDDPTAPPEPGAPGFPDPTQLRAGDRLIVRVEVADLPAYCAWIAAASARLPACSLAPYSAAPGGLHRLHLVALTRLAVPHRVRVEARHDLLGIRLAQVALGFGADTLAGPIDATRHLPLAGVPRPNETSEDALAMLVTQAGLDPVLSQESTP